MKIYLVSSCLVGLATRYDGQSKPDADCIGELKKTGSFWVPVCPEQLGGLPTPRDPADLVGGDGRNVLRGKANVVTRKGVDVTSCFIRGAEQVLRLAEQFPVTGVYLKSGSPSCGYGEVLGVTAALLVSRGYSIRSF